MKNNLVRIRLVIVTFLITLILVRVIYAQGSSTTSMINAINQRRVGQGLTALLSHPDLMEVAQQHSQYLSTISEETEIGLEGSSPADRAEAIGFGQGAEIHIFENEACVAEIEFEEILDSTWTEPDQQQALFDPEAQYIGAGISYAGEQICYTVVTGYWMGEPDPLAEPSRTPRTPSSSTMPTEVPIVVSTPGPDGTVKHQVKFGQTLWIVAAVYNIPLEEIRELNGFDPERVVNPGDEVIIRPSFTPTNTPIGEPSPTLPPRFTHTPSPVGYQGTSAVYSPATASPTEVGISEPRFRTSAKNPSLVIAAVLISGGTLTAALIISLRDQD
jgi:LysM repeat protein